MQRKKCRHLRSRGRFERILPMLMILLAWPLAAGIAGAQEAPVVEISATHSLTGSVDQGDGTFAVTYEVTLVNDSGTDLNMVSLTPVPDKTHFFLDLSPAPLQAGTLLSGQTVTVAWTTAQSFMAEAGLVPPFITFHGSATDSTATAVSVFVFSRGETGQ